MKIISGWRSSNYLSRFGTFLITVVLIMGMTGCDGYTPTSKDLEIWDWYGLYAVRNNLDGSHILMNDLDSTTAGYTELASPAANGGKGWQPIGDGDNPFTGTFDGQEYQIEDLFINRPTENGVGLFSYVDEGGVIENVGMVNIDVTGCLSVGGLVGANEGTVSNSYSTGSLTGNDFIGGLLGVNSFGGTVSNSYSTGNVTGNECVGGLVGYNRLWSTVSNSYSSGNVTGHYSVGGLVGFLHEGIVSNSYYNYDEVLINGENIITIGALFSGDFEQWLANDKFLDVNERLSQENGYYVINNITDFKELLAFGQDNSLKFRLKNDIDLATEPNFYIPYLAGEFDGNGHRTSNITFNFDFVSQVGFFGYLAFDGNLTQVAAEDVNITGTWKVGGLVGGNGGTVSNSYSSGNVTGELFVGGLVGASEGTVSNSYSSGNVTGNDFIGGLVGVNGGTVSNSYSSANVTGEDGVGGLVGSNSFGTVSNSYSTGSVSGNEDVGGLVGMSGGNVSESFWDTETSGQATSDGGTGKNTTEMRDITTFSDAGWNITAVANPSMRNPEYIWNIVDEVAYPFLSWEP